MRGLNRVRWLLVGMTVSGLLVVAGFFLVGQQDRWEPWTDAERGLIQSLSLSQLPAPPEDASNRVADDPAAAELGHRLFFDQRLSANGQVACSTCHQPDRYFTDGLAVSVGIGPVTRNAMSLVGAAYSPWLFWDGRKDSLWAQAAGPLEHPLEHGSQRAEIAELIRSDEHYRQRYEALFGELAAEPDEVQLARLLTNVGKSLAAYQRLLQPGPSRFDRYADELTSRAAQQEPSAVHESVNAALNERERLGLRLFIGRGQCTNCHNGPLLTNNAFHNTGSLSAPGQLPSRGRISGVEDLLADPFNCLGAFSDDSQRQCVELRFMRVGDELLGAHRTPSLRSVSRTAPYLHAGQLDSLEAVVEQYDVARDAMLGHNEAKPLGLSRVEKTALVAFLGTLESPVNVAPRWLEPPPK